MYEVARSLTRTHNESDLADLSQTHNESALGQMRLQLRIICNN